MEPANLKTSEAKFEEFFSTKYKNTVLEVIEKFPDQRSVVVDYTDLEKFDQNLAEILIEKPEETTKAALKAIHNMDPLHKKANIRILFTNIPYSHSIDNINL